MFIVAHFFKWFYVSPLFCYSVIYVFLLDGDEREFAVLLNFLKPKNIMYCQNVCDALTFLLENTFIRFGTNMYRQVVGNPMGTNSVPLVADLFLYCYERDFMMSLSDDKQADIIDAFNTTSRYLDDILNIDNVSMTLCKSNIPFRAPT